MTLNEHAHAFHSFNGQGRWNALVSTVNFQSSGGVGFYLTAYFSVLTIKLQRTLPEYFFIYTHTQKD